MSQNITRTFLRTKETMERYMRVMKERKEKGIKSTHFIDYDRILVKEFKYWVIVENEFPYDAVATTSHMISTKREISLDWKMLNKEEKNEFEEIKNTYLVEHYDAIWENLPKGQTVPGHFHLHLIVLKREIQ